MSKWLGSTLACLPCRGCRSMIRSLLLQEEHQVPFQQLLLSWYEFDNQHPSEEDLQPDLPETQPGYLVAYIFLVRTYLLERNWSSCISVTSCLPSPCPSRELSMATHEAMMSESEKQYSHLFFLYRWPPPPHAVRALPSSRPPQSSTVGPSGTFVTAMGARVLRPRMERSPPDPTMAGERESPMCGV